MYKIGDKQDSKLDIGDNNRDKNRYNNKDNNRENNWDNNGVKGYNNRYP